MSERWVVALAASTLAGAWWSHAIPWPAVVVIVASAGMRARPIVLCLAAAAMASALGARAWDGVRHAPTRGVVDSVVATLVRDPEWRFGSLRAEARLDDGSRVSVTASGEAAAVIAPMLAGERVVVDGRRRPVSETSRTFLARRHIGSALVVTAARDADPGGPVARFTNHLRRMLVDGAASLPQDRRSLFTGLVLGDDREQSATEVDDFRAAGLTHLLAVSGQNVAFVLAVAAPLLRRLSLRGRLVAGGSVLLAFGVLTRWEPSVLRAVAMAALSLGAATLGRPASSIRVLGLAVTALVLIDPMLAGSVGFLLSASACAGIAVLGPGLEARGVPAPLAVTVAAQVGVAPVLVPVFGGIPLASVPANLLAVPAAGPVMVWGLVAGLPAGIVGGWGAAALHMPSRLLLGWIAGVARVAASLPLPMLGPVAVMVLASGVSVALVTRRRMAPAIVAAMAVVVVTVHVRASRNGLDGVELAPGARLWRDEAGAVVLVLAGNADDAAMLAGLRDHGVRRVDVLVLRSGGSSSARLAAAVRHRATVRLVLAPGGHQVPGANATRSNATVGAGALTLHIEAARGRLDVRVASARAPRARSPPV